MLESAETAISRQTPLLRRLKIQYLNPSHPGDLKKFQVSIDGKDISKAVIAVDVYQSVFDSTWSAQVFCEDSSDLLTTIPIKAGKEVKVKIETDFGGFKGDGEKEFKFVVYRVGDKALDNHKNQMYTIYVADKAFIENQKKRVRRIFTNMKPEDIISTLVKEELGGGTVDSHESDDNVTVVIPAWTAFNAAGWITRSALHKKAADYLFYQTDDEKFAFKSFEEIYKGDEKVPGTFRLRYAGAWEDGNYPDDFTFDIQHYQWQHFDGMAAMSSGLYKSKTVSIDLINKQWGEKVFTYGDDTPEDLEGKNFEDEEMAGEETNISFVPKHPGMFEQGKSVGESSDEWVGSRKSAIQKMDSERLVVVVPGSAKAWEWIGKAADVELPAQEDMSGEILDKYRKGKYVVMAICHNIKKNSYMCNIELVKKRLEKAT